MATPASKGLSLPLPLSLPEFPNLNGHLVSPNGLLTQLAAWLRDGLPGSDLVSGVHSATPLLDSACSETLSGLQSPGVLRVLLTPTFSWLSGSPRFSVEAGQASPLRGHPA